MSLTCYDKRENNLTSTFFKGNELYITCAYVSIEYIQ